MKKKNKDCRVNKNFTSIKEYTVFLFVLAAFNGFHMWIYQILYQSGVITENPRFAINILMLFVLVTAAIIVAIISLIRERSFISPIRKLSEAVRKIAMGDFSVRIVQRQKKKKDFIDVMFDDFNTMAQELASIETLKNDFIANVSHEIKTPLSVIQHYSKALQKELPSAHPAGAADKCIEYAQTIIEATQKLSALVTNILKLNKLENQEILTETKPFNLAEQLRQCVLSFIDQIEQKNINFEEELDEVIVCYNQDMLEIVWNNLLSNAVKFTSSGGSIYLVLKLHTDNSGKSVKISISDTGCGMDKATQKRIFDKFYQGDTSHSKDGNGLGLALVKKTIELLGGTITVESVPGQGSMFTVTLQETI